jgi:hypothetical protein
MNIFAEFRIFLHWHNSVFHFDEITASEEKKKDTTSINM